MRRNDRASFATWPGLAACALAASCASGQRPVAYSGDSEPVIVAPEDVAEASALPSGYEQIGELRGRCILTPGFRSIEDEPLSDVDCSERRLNRAFDEAAAEAGGDLLIERRCASRSLGKQGQIEIFCRAGVARPEQERLRERALSKAPPRAGRLPAPGPAAVERLDEPSISATFGVRVAFTPRVREFSFPPRRADLVHHRSVLPVSHRALGDLVTRCEEGCSFDDLRFALYAAAGRLGATDVVGVRCFSEHAGSACVATAAAPDLNPDADVAAR
jgi:hypothetical protein